MSAEHGYRCSKVAFLLVLLWPLVTGRPAAAVADPPLPYYDCQGNAITPEEFDELVERLAEIATGYGQVFTAPFGYCDERPLVIEGLPAECAFSQGWRNYLSDSPEAFLLEPLDVVLFTIDELIAEGLQIEPVIAQEMRAHNFRIGYLAGVVQTSLGEQGFHGLLFCVCDQTGAIYSVWSAVGVLAPDDCAVFRELHGCTSGERQSVPGFEDPLHPGWDCLLTFYQCKERATERHDEATERARDARRECLMDVLLPTGAMVIGCLTSGLAAGSLAGPAAVLAVFTGCGIGVLIYAGYLAALSECFGTYDRRVATAQAALSRSLEVCVLEREICLARAEEEYKRSTLAAAPPQQPEKPKPKNPLRPAPQKPGTRIRR